MLIFLLFGFQDEENSYVQEVIQQEFSLAESKNLTAAVSQQSEHTDHPNQKQPGSVKIPSINKEKEKRATFLTITEHQKAEFIESMKNKNTVRKTASVVHQFTILLCHAPTFETREISTIEAYQLDNISAPFCCL